MTAPLLEPRLVPVPGPGDTARIRFRQPVSTGGFVDAAWWPRSRNLTIELPPLFDALWTAGREVSRVSYPIPAWDPAPHRLRIGDRVVRLGGFTIIDRLTVMLTDAWGRERIDVLVIPPGTEPSAARRALQIASEGTSPYHAEEILQLALGLPPLLTAA